MPRLFYAYARYGQGKYESKNILIAFHLYLHWPQKQKGEDDDEKYIYIKKMRSAPCSMLQGKCKPNTTNPTPNPKLQTA